MASELHACEQFEFVDRSSKLRAASCLAVLREPGTTGAIRLPPIGRTAGVTIRPQMTEEAVPQSGLARAGP